MSRTATPPDRQLDRVAVAAYCGFTNVSTVDTYRARNTMPPEDGMLGRSPWWWESTIDKWMATRRRRTTHPSGESNDLAAPEDSPPQASNGRAAATRRPRVRERQKQD